MPNVERYAFTQVTPATDNAAGWARALANLAKPSCTLIEVDCQNGRLPAGLFAGLNLAASELQERKCSIRLINASAAAQAALRVFGASELVSVSGQNPQIPPHLRIPGTIRYDGAGQIVITVEKNANQDSSLKSTPDQQWIQGLACVLLSIDLHDVGHVSSNLVAWLLQLAQAAKPAATEVRGVSRQVSIQLSQLRLNHLMGIKMA
jgi:hypothetical protein